MPLRKGSSRKTVSHNVGEMVDSWKKSGKLGTSRPRSKKAAMKQAVAISLKKAGKSNYQKPGQPSKNQPAKKNSAKSVRLVHSHSTKQSKHSHPGSSVN